MLWVQQMVNLLVGCVFRARINLDVTGVEVVRLLCKLAAKFSQALRKGSLNVADR